MSSAEGCFSKNGHVLCSALERVVHGRASYGGAPMSCVASAARARALCACPVGIPSEHPPSPFRLHFPLRASPMARSAPLSVVERWTLLNITQHEGVAQGCLTWRILVLLAHLASYRSSGLRRRKLITPSMMSAAAAELLAGKRSNSARRRILLDAASLRGPRRVVGDRKSRRCDDATSRSKYSISCASKRAPFIGWICLHEALDVVVSDRRPVRGGPPMQRSSNSHRSFSVVRCQL